MDGRAVSKLARFVSRFDIKESFFGSSSTASDELNGSLMEKILIAFIMLKSNFV